MTNAIFSVSLAKNPLISLNVTEGHFTTSHCHLTHFLDLSNLKSNSSLAKNVAVELVSPYLADTAVDTIVCMEGTEVIGAYMAQELLDEEKSPVNRGRQIHVVTPISNANRNLMFQSNMQELIHHRNIIVMVSSISSGMTLEMALECLNYYEGRVVGISALFNAYPERQVYKIHSLFTSKDIPGYMIYRPHECPMCREGHKLDAIIVQDGYIKIGM